MSDKDKPEMTEIEKRLAERAEAEFEQSEASAEIAPTPAEPAPSMEISMFDSRWEPPARPFYDYEVAALINRDCGRYQEAGLLLDSIEDVDAWAGKMIEEYGDRMSEYQAHYYRSSMAMKLCNFVHGMLIQQQLQAQQADRATYNQIRQDAVKPSKKRRPS